MEMFVVVCGKEKNENFFDDAWALFCEIAIRILFVHFFVDVCILIVHPWK
jgi:hypothetical protein